MLSLVTEALFRIGRRVSLDTLFRRRGTLNSETELLYSLSEEAAGRKAGGVARGRGSFEAGRGMPERGGLELLLRSMAVVDGSRVRKSFNCC